VSARIARLRELEAVGARVLVAAADVASEAAMRAVRRAAEERWGPELGRIRGIVHAAGVAGGGLLRGRRREEVERVLAPKVRGALVLDRVFGDRPLDFFVLCSSVTGLLPEIGQADYAAANCFLDAFAAWRSARAASAGGRAGGATVAIAWDAWREVGMAAAAEVPAELAEWRRRTLERGLATAEGVEAFRRALAAGLPEVAVSTVPWAERLEEHRAAAAPEALEEAARPSAAHARPELVNPFVAPEGELEAAIARVWQELLGIERVGVHDNFFDLGGNSLAGLRIIRALKHSLGEEAAAGLSEVSLYEAPTVAALARLLDGAAAAEEPVAALADEHRSRGERRKARMLRKRGVAP
jgi:hypothetical protein